MSRGTKGINNNMAGSGQTTHTFTGDSANYSHDFQNQIGDYTNKANEQYNQYNADKASAAQREAAYDDAFKNQTSYSDLMTQAENRYGVNDANSAYQNSLRAVAATNQAMSALPSTINANSGVVLNQAQRNAALGNQMAKYQNTLSSWQQQNAVDQSALNTALQRAGVLAQGNYSQEQQNIANALNIYQTALANAQQTYQQALGQENLLRDVYAKMYQDEYNHNQMDYNYWYGNLQDKWKQQEVEAQKYAADAAMRVQQYLQSLAKQNEKTYKNWDFGNGYQLQENANGESTYLKNGKAISAGQFLEGTGANGANWDLWNDVWNNGVSTRGVGSDTVSAFNYMSPASEKYNYLFGL